MLGLTCDFESGDNCFCEVSGIYFKDCVSCSLGEYESTLIVSSSFGLKFIFPEIRMATPVC